MRLTTAPSPPPKALKGVVMVAVVVVVMVVTVLMVVVVVGYFTRLLRVLKSVCLIYSPQFLPVSHLLFRRKRL